MLVQIISPRRDIQEFSYLLEYVENNWQTDFIQHLPLSAFWILSSILFNERACKVRWSIYSKIHCLCFVKKYLKWYCFLVIYEGVFYETFDWYFLNSITTKIKLHFRKKKCYFPRLLNLISSDQPAGTLQIASYLSEFRNSSLSQTEGILQARV